MATLAGAATMDALAAAAHVCATALHMDPLIAGAVAFLAGLGLRAGAIRYRWALPGFEARNS